MHKNKEREFKELQKELLKDGIELKKEETKIGLNYYPTNLLEITRKLKSEDSPLGMKMYFEDVEKLLEYAISKIVK